MSEVVTRILRAAGETSGATLHALVLEPRRAHAAAIVERLSALGCRAVAVPDEAAAAELLASDAEFNALVVQGGGSHAELVALSARLRAGRTEPGFLALINITDDPQTGIEQASALAANVLIQNVGTQDLPNALNAVNRSVALATDEVQRQVEIIARAVIKLGQRLHRITKEGQEAGSALEAAAEIADDRETALDKAEVIATLRSLIRSRRLRDRFFPNARFGEPAWDILLDLALAWFEDKSVSASSVCIAAGVPLTTAMRWINEMVDANLIERWIDPTDGRRSLVQIAPATRAAMLRYIAALKQAESLNAPSEK